MVGDRGGLTSITLLYDGWQVWDGVISPARVGAEFDAAIEFVPRSKVRAIPPDRATCLTALGDHRYIATARVAEVDEMVILDVGVLRLHRWMPPHGVERWVLGSMVELEVTLNVGTWGDRDVATAPIARHDAEHRLRIDTIRRQGPDGVPKSELIEVDETCIDPADYVLLDCAVLD